MSRIIPLSIHDRINEVEYLLEAIFMAAGSIGDRDHVNAIQHVVMIAQKEMLEIEAQLEALDCEVAA